MDNQFDETYDRGSTASEDAVTNNSRRRGDDSIEGMIRETRDRTKRLETRVTSALVHMGVDTPAQRPKFLPGTDRRLPRLQVPSKHCSLKDLVDTIPKTCDGDVEVFVGSDRVATIRPVDRDDTQSGG